MNSEFMRSMVRGFVWKVRMINGAVFEWWTPTSQTTRKEAVKELLKVANGDWFEPGEEAYDKETIEAVWKTKGIRSND